MKAQRCRTQRQYASAHLAPPTFCRSPARVLSKYRGLGSGLVSLVAHLSDALGVIGWDKKVWCLFGWTFLVKVAGKRKKITLCWWKVKVALILTKPFFIEIRSTTINPDCDESFLTEPMNQLVLVVPPLPCQLEVARLGRRIMRPFST